MSDRKNFLDALPNDSQPRRTDEKAFKLHSKKYLDETQALDERLRFFKGALPSVEGVSINRFTEAVALK